MPFKVRFQFVNNTFHNLCQIDFGRKTTFIFRNDGQNVLLYLVFFVSLQTCYL